MVSADDSFCDGFGRVGLYDNICSTRILVNGKAGVVSQSCYKKRYI